MTNSLVQELGATLIEGRKALFQHNAATYPLRSWLEEHSALMDGTLRRIYDAAWEAARSHHPAEAHEGAHPERDAGLALIAIGGYGRAELCPYSDIDIAFVPAEEEHPITDAVVKEAFRLIVEVFIDRAKIDVGYAYRPISDCERLDLSSKTALLEARRLAGSERLLHLMRDELHHRWDAVEFLLEKVRERRDIAQRLPLSLYAVEPHLKEGAGGLRDVHAAFWVAAAMLRTDAPLRELEWRGVVTATDCDQVIQARDFFLRLRLWLHLRTGKKTDVLREEYQDECARAFSFPGSGGTAAQRLLATYYRHAEIAVRFSEKVMRRLLEGPLPIDGHFVATHKRLHAAHPYTLGNHPELIVAPFALARKYGFTIDPQLERDIEAARPLVNDEARHSPIARAGFFALLSDVSTAADAISELRACGVLQALIPETQEMLHLAPADPSHQLTVGEHSIHAVRYLGNLWNRRLDDDELRDVWDGVDDVSLLVLATLLHDVGKIRPGTDHSISGAELARTIGTRLGLSHERCEHMALLVLRHLLLPRVARLGDLGAPGTIRRAMEEARDVPTLKMLYLLSLADTCAVGERTYSAFDLQTMRELYERVLMAMTREETAEVLTDTEKREQMVQRERERLRIEMTRHLSLDEASLQRLCADLPASYLLNTPLPTIATHLQFLDQLPVERLIIDSYPLPRNPFTEMTVVAYDDPQPGLLSKICGVVYAIGAEILAAHVYTVRGRPATSQLNSANTGTKSGNTGTDSAPTGTRSADTSTNSADTSTNSANTSTNSANTSTNSVMAGADIVLDRLHIVSNGRPLAEARAARLAALLRDVLLGHKSIEDVLKAAGKEHVTGVVPKRISARNDLSDEHTVVTIVSDNVPGLLYHVTSSLAAIGLDVHTAKITTWAGNAEDAFYVTHRNGDGRSSKIGDDDIKQLLEDLKDRLQQATQAAPVA